MPYEWDEGKNRLNKLKHGVSFEQATKAFDDPYGSFLLAGPTGRKG